MDFRVYVHSQSAKIIFKVLNEDSLIDSVYMDNINNKYTIVLSDLARDKRFDLSDDYTCMIGDLLENYVTGEDSIEGINAQEIRARNVSELLYRLNSYISKVSR